MPNDVFSQLLRPVTTQLHLKASGPMGLAYSAGVIGGVNLLGFGITATFKTHKITDLVGTGAFVLAAAANAWRQAPPGGWGGVRNVLSGPYARPLMLNAAVGLWGIRLGGYLFQRILITGEDDRLAKFFPKEGEGWLDASKSQFPLKLAAFWGIQAAWAWVVSFPVTIATANMYKFPAVPLGIGGKLAFLMFGAGLLIEAIADQQKFNFKQKAEKKGRWIDSGLWSICRHPNYLGELLVWSSVFLASFPMLRGPTQLALGVCSPVFIATLLLFVSGVPLLEQKYDERYRDNKDYQHYKETVPLLLPNLFKLGTAGASSTTQSKTD